MISLRIPFLLVFALSIFFPYEHKVQAQEASGASTVSSGGTIFRIGFMEMLHQTFLTEEDHPFYQMTGSNRYLGGKGYQDIPSFNPTDVMFPDGISTNVNMKKALDGDGHKSVDSTLGKWLDYLPTFSFEVIVPTDFFVYAGLSFHYTTTWQEEVKIRAATMGSDPRWDTPMLHMFTRYLLFTGNIYITGPPQPGEVDLFWGIGLGRIESTYRWGFYPNPETNFNYPSEGLTTQSDYQYSSGTLTAIQRFGLGTSAKNFGFMLEFFRIPGDKVYNNPFSTQTFLSQAAYNSTYNDRGTDLPKNAGMRGMITRASWTYMF